MKYAIIFLSLMMVGCGCFGSAPSQSLYGPEAIKKRMEKKQMVPDIIARDEKLDVLIVDEKHRGVAPRKAPTNSGNKPRIKKTNEPSGEWPCSIQ